MGPALLLIPAFAVLMILLARRPRRVEGLLVACTLSALVLIAYVTWQAKTSDLDSAGVNVNAASAADIAQVTGVPLEIAEAVVRSRELEGGFASISDIPSLGRTSNANRRKIQQLARNKHWKALRSAAHTGRLPDERTSTRGSGLFASLDLRLRAMQALADPPLDLRTSARAVLLAHIDSEAVVDRIIQFRRLEWRPYPGEILRISDIPAVPTGSVVLRTREEAFSLYWRTIFALVIAVLAVHVYLRLRKPRADQFILPLLGGLGILGVIMLFSVSSPLRVASAVPGIPMLYGAAQPKYIGLALAVLVGLAIMPFSHRLMRLIGTQAAQGALVIAVLAPLAANFVARWGSSGVFGVLVFGAVAAAALHRWGRDAPAEYAPAVSLGRYITIGIVITATLTAGRIMAGRSGYAPFLEFAKLALIIYTARLCAEHDFFLGRKLSRLPAAAVIPFVSVWMSALAFTMLAREMGVLLLLWIPCILLIGFAFSWREIAAGLALLVLGGAIVLWLAIGPFPDRVAMWLNPWTYTPLAGHSYSGQMAQAFHRMTSVPNPAAGLGLGRGTPPDIATNTQDLVLPLYFEQMGFAGVALVIVLFLVLIHRMFRISMDARDRFDHWLGLGFACAFGVQTTYILGANFGAWPLTGVTLAPIAFGKAACIGAFVMCGALLGMSESHRDAAGGAWERRRRTAAWVFAGLAVLGIYAAGKALKIGVIDRDSNALAHYSPRGSRNARIAALLGSLPRGRILARTTSTSYASAKVLAQSREGGSGRLYTLGPAAWPVVGVSALYGTTGGERDWLNRLTGVYDLVREEASTGSSDALERALLDQWRAQRHPLWPAESEWDEKLAPRDVQTTIVSSLQLDAYRRLSDYLSGSVFRNGNRARKGAILMVDVRTGEYLAKVQFPSIDPNVLASGWKTWDRCATSPSGYLDPNGQIIDLVEYTDRAPGSTAKLNTIMALLESGQGGRKFFCGPGVKVNGREIHDFHGASHGWVDAEKIIKYSCNRGAAQAAEAVGSRRLLSLYRERLRYRLPHMERPARDFRAHLEKIAFGQVISASLCDMMTTVCAIARGGEAIELHVLRRPPEDVERWRVCDPKTASALTRYMISAAKRGGTAYRVYKGNVAWPSKTGSAELAGASNTDAWFVGFAPAQNPRVAFVLWVEEDGTGGNMAEKLGLMSMVNRALRATAE